MRAFRCPHCGYAVAFEQQSCFVCSTEVAFHKPWMEMVLAPADGESTTIDDGAWVRCANWERGCNWLVAAGPETPICFVDGFVRNEPGPDDTEALKELASTLKDLRRLIFQLLDLGLPITPFHQDPKGLAFDLISSESVGHPVTIGHADGVITIDLAESLELYRERQRIILKEPYRTMLGHLRHEVGHYYEMILIAGGELIDETREFFGDERRDYQAALADYYAGVVPDGWEHDYISHYATAHPWEDWAETFAHYLHITGTLATIADSGLLLSASRVHFDLDADINPRVHYGDGDFATMLHDWEVLSGVLNRVNHAMGKEALYPFRLTLPVVAKLGFVYHVLTTAEQGNKVDAPDRG
jgi:hypothetical protein